MEDGLDGGAVLTTVGLLESEGGGTVEIGASEEVVEGISPVLCRQKKKHETNCEHTSRGRGPRVL
jgi:hypothetical protein